MTSREDTIRFFANFCKENDFQGSNYLIIFECCLRELSARDLLLPHQRDAAKQLVRELIHGE